MYTVKLKLSEIPPHRIFNLTDTDWLYAVLANRKSVQQFNELDLAKRWIEKINSYDVVIGPIADDRMNEAMQRFAEYTLTDEGLRECLKYVNYGKQYVAKTQSACEKIEILSKRALSYEELESVRDYSREKRKERRDIIEKMTIEYRNKGSYLDEIINFQKNRAKGSPIR